MRGRPFVNFIDRLRVQREGRGGIALGERHPRRGLTDRVVANHEERWVLEELDAPQLQDVCLCGCLESPRMRFRPVVERTGEGGRVDEPEGADFRLKKGVYMLRRV